jgi:AmmeMemoRadiSam system protein B/AmmeMemoRadiSam system protein A
LQELPETGMIKSTTLGRQYIDVFVKKQRQTRVFGMFIIYHALLAGLFFVLPSCSKASDHTKDEPIIIHEAHLPQGWYEQDTNKLHANIDQFFTLAQKHFAVPIAEQPVKALVVPHAGHYYSGLCAATAYQTLLVKSDTEKIDRRKNTFINRAIVLCPTHTTFYNGIALPEYTQYKTALGTIPVDTLALHKLKKSHVFKVSADVHKKEHAIEVQLPFLQKTIAEFSLIPLIVGHMSPDDDAIATRMLRQIIDEKTLVVISSDFTHHGPNYDYVAFDKNIIAYCRLLDSFAIQAITKPSLKDFEKLLQQTNATICGQEPLKILLALLETGVIEATEAKVSCYYTTAQMNEMRKNHDVKKLFVDVADDFAQNNVSYAGIVFTGKEQVIRSIEDRLTGYEKKALLHLAKATIANEFKPEKEKISDQRLLFPLITPGLSQHTGAFVTLSTKDGNLRGCIGRIISQAPLYQTVTAMSIASAFNDSRFKPVTQKEFIDLSFDISILTPPHTINNYKDIIIGTHGIILNKHNEKGEIIASSVFLPQVARDYHWDIETTLEQLSLKAGLARQAWKKDCSFEVFEGFEIKE